MSSTREGAGRLMDVAKRTARAAQKAGANDVRAKVTRSREVRVEWRDGKLDRIRESTQQRLRVALFVDGRYSANATSDLDAEAVETWIAGAVAATRHLAADEHRRLPDPARYRADGLAELQLVDPGVPLLRAEDRLAVAKSMEEAARDGEGRDKVASVTTTVGDAETRHALFCTNGQEAEEQTTELFVVAEVSVRDTDDRKPGGYDWAVARHAGDMPPVDRVAHGARRRALDQLGSRQAATGAYDLIIENRAVGTFTRHLFAPLAGPSLQQRSSFFEGKKGETVASPLLTVTDNPRLVRGLASRRWDDEGMATQARPIFEEGVLRTYFLDTYYGSKLGMTPTTGGPSNLVWKGGDRDAADAADAAAMVSAIDEGILVTSFLGGNSNGTTGDFSLGIKGFYVKGGKLVHPVSEMNMAGNHLTFWKDLVEVGGDPWLYGANRTPSLRFRNVQCSGA